MRKLATIQQIEKIDDHPNADALEIATVLGWQVVVKKGEFIPGQTVIYCEVDSVLPNQEEYEFLRKCCWVDNGAVRGFRIRTIKLRGAISQGLCLPTALELPIGSDVTDCLGVVKFDKPIPPNLAGLMKGPFPSFVPKTDEIRIQAAPGVLERHRGEPIYITEKMDGASMTVYKWDGDFGVCSRNIDLKDDGRNLLWRVATELNLKSKLPDGYAIQGETIGPGIQNNRYKLDKPHFLAFSIYNINEGRYLNFDDFVSAIPVGIESVPIIQTDGVLDHTIDDLVSIATNHHEGIVVRSKTEKTDPEIGRLSFKVLNPNYLIKHGE